MTKKLTQEEFEELTNDNFADAGTLQQKKGDKWTLVAEEGSLIGDQILTDPKELCKDYVGIFVLVIHNDDAEIIHVEKYEETKP